MNDLITPEDVPQGNVLLKAVGLDWQRYVIYALLVVVLALTVTVFWQRGTVAKAQLKVANQTTQIVELIFQRDTSRANEERCRQNLTDQNEKIAEEGRRFNELQRNFDLFDKFIQDGIRDGVFYKRADQIRRLPPPKTCNEVLDFLNEHTQ